MADYCKIPITLLLRFAEDFRCDIFIKLSEEKLIKISHKDDNPTDILKKYHEQKNIQNVYVSKNDYELFLEFTNKEMSSKFFSMESTDEEKIELLDKDYQLLKESLTSLGMSKIAIDKAQAVTSNALRMVNRTPNLFRFLKQFRDKCSEEFMRSMMVGFTAVCLIDTFEWQTEAIKQKASLAATLCDVSLEPEDFDLLRRYEQLYEDITKDQLPPWVLEHPKTVSSLLGEQGAKWITKETLNMIEQHHERPDGSGFPYGINHQRISLLSSIFMVAFSFINLMYRYNFDFQKRYEIFAKLEKVYGKGTGKKAINALEKMLGI